MPARIPFSLNFFHRAAAILFTLFVCISWHVPPMFAAGVAPEFSLRTWNVENGLPSSIVNAIAQTPDDFLWIGTADGLVRFDGARFTDFSSRPGAAFRGKNISSLLVDHTGGLWVGTTVGDLFRLQNGVFTNQDRLAEFRGAKITALVADKDGAVWVNTDAKGVARWQDGRFTHFDKADGLPADGGFVLTLDAQGYVCLGGDNQVFGFRDGTWHRMGRVPPPAAIRIDAMTRSSDGGLWVAEPFSRQFFEGARLFKLKGGPAVPDLAPYPWLQDSKRPNIRELLEDRSDTLWVGTAGDGVFYRLPGEGWRALGAEGLLSRVNISCFFEDHSGTLWIGSEHAGLCQVHRKSVVSLTLPGEEQERLITTTLAARDGTVWVGTASGGVFRYDGHTFTRCEVPDGVAYRYVNTLWEDRHTNFWAGTYGGLLKWNGNRFEPVAGPSSLRRMIFVLFEDHAGHLWVGTSAGLLRHDGNDWHLYGQSAGLMSSDIRALAEAPDGTLWVAAHNDGLYRFSDDHFQAWNSWSEAARKDIRALYCDRNGVLWIGTFTRGLYRLEQGRFSGWTSVDGLPDNTIRAIVEGSDGRLWMSSNNGIFGVRKQELTEYHRGTSLPLTCRDLSVADGLVTPIGSGGGQPVVAATADGRLWFPTGKALAVFNPRTLPPVTPLPHVKIEEVVVDGVARPIIPGAALRLSSGARRLQLLFTAPFFEETGRLRFRYQLKGMDRDWVDAGEDRSASYSQLSPGNYQFRVMVGSESGWRIMQQPLNLVVVPQFWQRRGFRFSALAILLVAMAATARVVERARFRRRLRELEMRQALEVERRRIAQDLHDDIGSSVWQLTMLGQLAARDAGSPRKIRSHVDNIIAKSTALARSMDEIIWAINPRNDSLSNLISYLQHTATEYFDTSPIRCRVDAPNHLPPIPLAVNLRHNLFLAVKEALHNVAEHSRATEVWLIIDYAAPKLIITIKDDGCGFDAAPARTISKNGLANMDFRLRTMGGECSITSRPGQGCTVQFIISPAAHNDGKDVQT